MSNMKPSRFGSVPSEALSKGTLNETISAAEKVVPEPKKLDEGPKKNDDGAYLPASYKTGRGNVRTDR